jgi:hypothetical protein
VTPVKVLCGECGDKIGTVTDTPEYGRVYRFSAGQGGTANQPPGMWCTKHGWPTDLAGPEFAQKLASARDGRVRTHSARMSWTKPGSLVS